MRLLNPSILIAAAALLATGCQPPESRKPRQPARPQASVAAPEVPDVVVVAAPADAGLPPAPPAPDQSFRATPPTPRPVADVKLPTVAPFTLDNGLEVYLVEQNKLPTVFMSFEFDAGEIDDPADKTGMVSVCLDLYSEGTAELDKIAFAEKQADHAVTIWSPAGKETSTINLRTLKSELGPALDLLGALLRAPGLREQDFQRIIAQRKASLQQARATPQSVAMRLFSSRVWGRDHGYGRVQMESDIEAITLDDCRAFAARLKPDGARLWVVGMVSKDELTAALNQRLAFWQGAAPTPKRLPAAPKPDGAIHFVQVDGAVQAFVLLGHVGPARSADDYVATHLMTQILGGSFSSRINMNLREDKGWAYGGRGRISYRRQGSQLAIYASVENATAALAIGEMLREIKGMRDAEPTADELAREQQGALEALPAKFASPSETLNTLKRLAFFGLPLDYYLGYQASLREVDAAAVRAAAVAHLPDKGWSALVVGDGTMKAQGSDKTVLEALRELAASKRLGDGGLVVTDADGLPLE
ncbi:MAG: hypothetical protein CSA66_03185 [Proteobacteria bacterium]|nr:MAG: hypothetical protein CSA66_03185 [Pseudomonadota bacterium]